MAGKFASQSFDGAMRVDNNNQDRKNYQPNSYDKPSYSERSVDVPFAVANPIVSRQSHHKTEGLDVEYKQVRELYNRVMDATQRDHLHKNTATCMNAGVSQKVRTLYLAQIWNISPDYVRGIISYLTDKNVDVDEVEKLSKNAAMMGKTQKYKPKESALHFLTGRDVPINMAPYPEK